MPCRHRAELHGQGVADGLHGPPAVDEVQRLKRVVLTFPARSLIAPQFESLGALLAEMVDEVVIVEQRHWPLRIRIAPVARRLSGRPCWLASAAVRCLERGEPGLERGPLPPCQPAPTLHRAGPGGV